MGIGVKVGLVAGLATLVATAAAVFGAQAGGPKVDGFEQAGRLAAATLAHTDPKWWTGGGSGVVDQTRKVFVDLFGEPGKEWWDLKERHVTDPDFASMDSMEKEEAIQARERFLKAQRKWNAGGEDDGVHQKRLEFFLAQMLAATSTQDYRIAGAWIRKKKDGGEGDLVAAWQGATGVPAAPPAQGREGSYLARIGSSDVTVFYEDMDPRGHGVLPLRAYVALWPQGGGAGSDGGANPLGLLMMILGPLLVGGLAGAVASGHSKNVRLLAREIDRLGSSGDPSRTLRAQGGEAANLARSIERMVSNLEFRNKHGDDDLEEIVNREQKIAAEIHGALMAKNPPRLGNYEVETLFKPGFEIGGDHFEYFPIDDDHLGVILLDTNVRGIPAALVMATTKAYVRASAPGVLSPADVLREVNRNLAGDLPPGRHVTALYCVLDTKAGKATLASAGHLPLLVYRHASGKVAKVNPEGIALGLDVGPVFDRALQEGDIPIEVGDRIVLYTDGALNVANEEGEEYGESRFYQSVSNEAPKNSQAFVNFVGASIDRFHLPTPQSDDITISTVKRLR